MGDLLDVPVLNLLAERSVARVSARLSEHVPELASHTSAWMGSLSRGRPDQYFTRPQAFPMLLLPWWLEESISGAPDIAFQADIAYSTVCGYYFVRMIDDLMDGESHPAGPAMPAMIFFHTEFQQAYHQYFPADHPFWTAFTRFSYAAAETAAIDAALDSIDRAQFLLVSARKIAGAKIPLAAVCHQQHRPELIERWSDLADLLGRWHQMRNDVLGWARDMKRGRTTYFLSEAARRAGSEADISRWMARDGLTWAWGQLDGWMDELAAAAAGLGSLTIEGYLEERRRAASVEWQQMASDLVALNRLASSLAPRRC